MSLIKDYFAKTQEWIKEYGENTVVLMQVGAFFEVYGYEDKDGNLSGSRIADVLLICDLAVANKANGSAANEDKNVKMAGFRDHQLDKYLKRLNDAGWTAVVYTQDAATKNTTRSLMGIFSPGTFFADDTPQVSNNTMTVWLERTNSSRLRMTGKTFIGIAVTDIFTGRSYIAEYTADDKHNPSTYDDLERSISVYNPTEILVVSSFDKTAVQEVAQYTGMDSRNVRFVFLDAKDGLASRAKKAEKQSYQMETLRTFYPEESTIDTAFFELQSTSFGLQAFVFLLNYIYSHNPNLASQIEMPVLQHHNQRLVLANHSLKQLNMIADGADGNGKLVCVSSLLNASVTAGGKRTFMDCLMNPITDSQQLQSRYDITAISNKTGIWETIRTNLRNVKDLEKLNRKLILNRASPRDFVLISNSVRSVDSLWELLENPQHLENSGWFELRAFLETIGVSSISKHCNQITEFMDRTIDADEAFTLDSCQFNSYSADCVNKGSCFVKPGNYSELDAACTGGLIWQQQLNAITEYFDSLISKTETKARGKLVKLHETPSMAPSILLTKRRSAILKLELGKQKTSSVVLCKGTPAEFELNTDTIRFEPATSKADDCITSSQIRDLTLNMRTSKDNFNELLTNVFKSICNNLAQLSNAITKIADFVRHVDVIQARSYIATKYNYCKPEIVATDTSFVDAVGLRHPLIEHIQTSELYVTNDVSLNDKTSGRLLYGTNAVGKTSLIKALGISVIMAQAGLFVPCSQFTYCPYTAIFTRILGNDNIHRGLSTFAVEMIELRTILKMANQNSLILGDELCSGTESDSALSIFAAGIEHLHAARSSFIFATHFHEIADYEEVKRLERLKCNHMTVVYNRQLDTLVYDRKLKDGPGNSMYGLEVCKALDLPTDFLERAHQLRNKYNKQNVCDLDMKGSHFNKQKVMGRCEICGKTGTEVHHLQHQKNADSANRIKHFHKNHLANLITLCESCHDGFHATDVEYERKKTTSGYKLIPVSV